MQGFLKESGVYFDTKPKKGSNNAVTSDGIFKAIQEGGGGSGYDDTELRQRINANKNNIDRIDGKVSTIENNLTQAETDIETLESKFVSKRIVKNIGGTTSVIVKCDLTLDFDKTSYGRFSEVVFIVRSDCLRIKIQSNDGIFFVDSCFIFRNSGWITSVSYETTDTNKISLYIGILNYPATVSLEVCNGALNGTVIDGIVTVASKPNTVTDVSTKSVAFTDELFKQKALTSSSNIDDLNTFGVYYCGGSCNGTLPSGTTHGFTLHIFGSHNGFYQVMFKNVTLNDGGIYIYIRYKNSWSTGNSWTSWKLLHQLSA